MTIFYIRFCLEVPRMKVSTSSFDELTRFEDVSARSQTSESHRLFYVSLRTSHRRFDEFFHLVHLSFWRLFKMLWLILIHVIGAFWPFSWTEVKKTQGNVSFKYHTTVDKTLVTLLQTTSRCFLSVLSLKWRAEIVPAAFSRDFSAIFFFTDDHLMSLYRVALLFFRFATATFSFLIVLNDERKLCNCVFTRFFFNFNLKVLNFWNLDIFYAMRMHCLSFSVFIKQYCSDRQCLCWWQ